MLLYSGHNEESALHTQGVSLMLSKAAQTALIGWESRGSRIIKAPFKIMKEGMTMNVILCYALTNSSSDENKDQFYSRLQSIIAKFPRKDLVILMGDINVKVGMDNTGYEDIEGRHRVGEREENGERFSNLCAFNKSVIDGTIFAHKRTYKVTWISPDHTTENQINYICITKKCRRTMEDVKMRRGTDIDPYHHLVVATMKLKLGKHWTTGETVVQRFNTTLFRHTEKLNEFKIILNNRLQALRDILEEEETIVEDNWKGIKEVLTLTFQEVLGRKKHHHKEWKKRRQRLTIIEQEQRKSRHNLNTQKQTSK
ncbi:unnamed protein product [Schistosoma mattheei]|uniref:Uncharacterized protein n=1 Tax=Schistosoma mattheei TaxID=31246 RepID=A0A183PWM1_9TREM|nr:unnamed protein product [Schistosoma mattheei]